MRTLFLTIFALGLATPALAQPTKPTPAEAVPSPIDPTRLSAAKPVIDKLWPLGTYRRMMDGTMSKMMDAMIDSMMGMKASDMLGAVDKSGKLAKVAGGSSMGELAEKADPHFRERMKITMDVMMGEMIPLMENIEPQVRSSMTNIYARKYTASQLKDMETFFSTPTGSVFAEQSMLLFMDPEMMKGMQAFAPQIIQAMPNIIKKMEAATAHLPPVPKPKVDSDEAAAGAEAAVDAAADAVKDAVDAASDVDPAYDPANWSAEDRATSETLSSQYSAAGDKFFSFSEEAATRAKAKLNAKK